MKPVIMKPEQAARQRDGDTLAATTSENGEVVHTRMLRGPEQDGNHRSEGRNSTGLRY
jgi:hypothetical protein